MQQKIEALAKEWFDKHGYKPRLDALAERLEEIKASVINQS